MISFDKEAHFLKVEIEKIACFFQPFGFHQYLAKFHQQIEIEFFTQRANERVLGGGIRLRKLQREFRRAMMILRCRKFRIGDIVFGFGFFREGDQIVIRRFFEESKFLGYFSLWFFLRFSLFSSAFGSLWTFFFRQSSFLLVSKGEGDQKIERKRRRGGCYWTSIVWFGGGWNELDIGEKREKNFDKLIVLF
jgi:hypothetical protein